MQSIRVISIIITFIIASLLGFFIGRATDSSDSSIDRTEITDTDEIEDNDLEDEQDDDDDDDDEEEVDDEEREKVVVPKLTKDVHPQIKTGISDRKISQVLTKIADRIQAQKLAYDKSKRQDCSGIYHMIKDQFKDELPALADGSKYVYPEIESIRSSRQIAYWYHENDNLTIINDAVQSRNSIRPGSVMFFGKSGKRYSNMNIGMLTDHANNFTSNGAITHIAVVTSVRTDEDGNVQDYTMMHARNSKYPASKTGSSEVQSEYTPGLPPFGNWQQQWVAVANITTAK